ncbi:hypothetical protein [Rhodoblastus sp.]|uniref:hypothetical protein n=1 Tax=Rhodoblastus sp. TaxID=1962975 RepID=UPI003F98841D
MPTTVSQRDETIEAAFLKNKQRSLRDGFPPALSLRVHWAISWLARAEDEKDDDDLRFILLWIGFNSAYARDIGLESSGERGMFSVFSTSLWPSTGRTGFPTRYGSGSR